MLYVGKAKNLKNRIAQYRQRKQLSTQKQQLVQQAVNVLYTVYESELEALLAEAEFIRLYRPEFNILLKDDRSPLYIIITDEEFPRVLTVRRQELVKQRVSGEVFGPYQSAYMARQVLRTVRPAFRWCNLASSPGRSPEKKRACFYYHVFQCSGACVGAIDQEEYRKMIRRLKAFLRGNSKVVQKSLKKEIEHLSGMQQFEQAARLKQEYEAITTITQPTYHLAPDLALLAPQRYASSSLKKIQMTIAQYTDVPEDWQLRRIECYDVSNFQGKYASVSMVVFTNGVSDPKQYRLFNIQGKDTPDDFAMMAEALYRRQGHPEWGVPDLILIDGGKGQLSAVQEVWEWQTPVVGIAKDPDRLVIPHADLPADIVPVTEMGQGGKILQQLRDEAHRFAKRQVHRRLANRDIAR